MRNPEPGVFYLDQPKPEGDWIGWKGWFELAGSHHRADDVARFASAATKTETISSAAVVRDPHNPYDKNAIAFLGEIGPIQWHLGYVPRADAKEIAAFAPAMPLAGRIMSVRFIGDKVYVRVQMFIPSKKTRLANNWGA